MAIQPLSFKITADTSGLTAGLNQALGQLRGVGDRVKQSFSGVTQEATSSLGSVGSAVTGMVGRLGVMAGVYASLRGIQAFAEMSDQAAMAAARIQGLTGSIQATKDAQAALFEMSQRLQAPLADALSSFSRMLPAVQSLGGGVKETTRLTEIMMTTAKLSGASAAEAGASAMQFAQALSSGVLQGDELRSIMENNGTLTRLLADGLGVSIGQLRKMGEEGKLTADLVANVLLGQYSTIQAKAAELPGTVGGAWTEIRNAFTLLVTTVSTQSGVFSAFAELMKEVARAITSVTLALGDADKESTKLGQNRGAVSWAQAVGLSFAYVADVVRSAVSAILNNLRGLSGMLEQLTWYFAAVGYAALGNFDMAKAAVAKAGEAVNRLTESFARSRDAAVEFWNAAQGGGKAVGNYIEGMVGAPVQANTAPGATLKTDATQDDKGDDKERKRIADQLALEMDAIEKQIAAQRKAYEVARSVSDTRTEMDRDRALAAIEGEQRVAKFQLDTQQITQVQYLQAELQFELQKYEIRRQATERLLELAKAEGRDPAEVERINQQLLALELDYQARKQGIVLQVQADAAGKGGQLGNAFGNMAGQFNQALASMATSGKSFGQTMTGIWNGLRSTVSSNISKMLTDMLRASIAERSMTLGKIGADAAKAASGAYSAMAGIPYVGPILAPIAAGVAFAAVMAFGSGIKSAKGGYDIPAGLNPVMQLHAEEMVLPAEHANTIRKLSEGGSAGGDVTVNLQGTNVGDFFIAHRKDFVKALKDARREFAFA